MKYNLKSLENIENRVDYDIRPKTCGDEKCKPSHSYGPAVREYWLLHFVVSGRGEFSTSRGKYSLSENEIFIIKPGEVTYYEADSAEPWEYIWIGFMSNAEMPRVFYTEDKFYAPYLEKIFLSLRKIISGGKNKAYQDFLCGKIWQIIGTLRSLEDNIVVGAKNYVKAAIDIMEAEYHRDITINEISKELHINRSYFSTMFEKNIGVSAKYYLMTLRMKKAAEMLLTKQYTVSVVATSVGYSELSTFSRAFKGYFGVSAQNYK